MASEARKASVQRRGTALSLPPGRASLGPSFGQRPFGGATAESSTGPPDLLPFAEPTVRPAHERVLEREAEALAQEREAETLAQERERTASFASGDPRRSPASSCVDERGSMAHRKNEPAVSLAALKRMQLVFELHEWRMERRRQTLLCFMSSGGGGDDLSGAGEDDIETMLLMKEKQQKMEKHLREMNERRGNHTETTGLPRQSKVTEPNPGIPFNVFERDIVEPFFDSLFPPAKTLDLPRLSRFSHSNSPTLVQGLMSGSRESRSFGVHSRCLPSSKFTYQRRRASHVEAAENLFRLVDTNLDGFVSWNELSSYILQSGQRLLAEDDSLQFPISSLQKRKGNEAGRDGGGTLSSRLLTFAPHPTNIGVWQQQYPLVRFLHHSQPIRKLLSSRGRRYVTIAWDGLVKLWRHDPCLADARGKPAIIHERNLFAAGAPVIDAALSPESFGDSEMAVVVAIDGTVTLLRVSSGEVIKTFVGRCSMPAPEPMHCVSSTKERRRTWRPRGFIGDARISKDLRTGVEGTTSVLRPTFKVKAYHRDAIDIFFTDVSRYFSGLGVVAPTFEHLERRRAVRSDVLQSFGDKNDALDELGSIKKEQTDAQEQYFANEGVFGTTRSTGNMGSSSFISISSSSSSSSGSCSRRNSISVRDGTVDTGGETPTNADVSLSYTDGKKTTRTGASGSRSLPTSSGNFNISFLKGTEALLKNPASSCVDRKHSPSEFRESLKGDSFSMTRKKPSKHTKLPRQLASEKSWFARSVALARYNPTTSTTHLSAGAYLLLGFETGVLQLYRMRLEWFCISNLCSTRVEPPATHTPVLTITLHRAAITHILFSESSGFVMTGSDDATVVVRQIGRIHIPFVTLGEGVPLPGTIPSHNHGHTRRITCMCYEVSRGLLVTGGMDRHVFSWLPSSPRPMQHVDLRNFSTCTTKHSGYPIDVSFMQPPRQPLLLIVLDSRRSIFIFDAVAFNCVHFMSDDSSASLHGGPLLRVRYDVGDDRLVLAGKYLRTWDTACDDTYPHDYQGHRRPLVGLAFQRHWRYWVSADDSIVIIWKGELNTNQPRMRDLLSSNRSGTSSAGWALNTTSLRSWSVKGGISCISVDQTESAHVFVALLHERCIEEYNIFTGTVLRTFDFPAKVGEIASLACSAPVLNAPPPAIYHHLSPLSFICGTFERDQSRDGTTALYSLASDSGGLVNGIRRLILTSEVGVSSAVIIASLGLVVVGHRGGISITPFDESTTCPIACLRLTDKPPKDSAVGVVRNSHSSDVHATNTNGNNNSYYHQRRHSSFRLLPPGAQPRAERRPNGSQQENDAEAFCDKPGHCRHNPPLDLVALFPGPLVHDPVAITRECMLHREQYLFHDDKACGAKAAVSLEGGGNNTVDGDNNNRNKNASINQNDGSATSTQSLLLFSEEFTATASLVGSSFGVFIREQLSSLGFVLHVTPVADTGYIATGSDDGLVQFWNLRTMTEVMRFRATYTIDTVTAMDVCPSAVYAAVGDASGYVLLLHIGSVAWNSAEPLEMVRGIESGIRVKHRWRGHKQGISSVRFVHSSSHSSQFNSSQMTESQRQRGRNLSTESTSRPATTGTAVGLRRKPSVRLTTARRDTSFVDGTAPIFLCTSGEDTYIYAWSWQHKQQQRSNGADYGELHCIGCFGGGIEVPSVPPLDKWTESAWRVLDAVRRLYVTERLMSPTGPLGEAGFTVSSPNQPNTAALEQAAAFIVEDMQTVRETGASLRRETVVASRRSHGSSASRNTARETFRRGTRPYSSSIPPYELAPTYVFAFEDGSYYDRNLKALIARTVAEIKGFKLKEPESPEEFVESKASGSTTNVVDNVKLAENGGSSTTKEEDTAAQGQPHEEGTHGGEVPVQAAVPKKLSFSGAQLKATLSSPKDGVETACFFPSRRTSRNPSIATLALKEDALQNDTSTFPDENKNDRGVVLPSDQAAALPTFPPQDKDKDPAPVAKPPARSSLPTIGHLSLNHLSRVLSNESASPSGRELSPLRALTWDHAPPVAVAYETATPLPRLRPTASARLGVAGADAAAGGGAQALEPRLPVLSQVMPPPGSPKARPAAPAEKTLLKQKTKTGVVPSKFFERYMDFSADPLIPATGSEERKRARRARKRREMLWGPVRVMNTLMAWKAPIVDTSSSAGLRRRCARDNNDAFCDTDEAEISLPLCVPLSLGVNTVGPRPGSGPLVERRASVVKLEAEVHDMKMILHAAMLEKQLLVVQERNAGNVS